MKEKCKHKTINFFRKLGKPDEYEQRCMKCHKAWPVLPGVKIPNAEESLY